MPETKTRKKKLKDGKYFGVAGVAKFYEDGETQGTARIEVMHVEHSTELFVYNLRQAMKGMPNWFAVRPGTYVLLHIQDGRQTHMMMSDTAMERYSNKEFIDKASGDVLIAGLGIGMVINAILPKPEVKSITVIEQNLDVIKMVEPKFRHEKLSVIHSDIFDYKPSQKFDTIYFDIWPEIKKDNLIEIALLHSQFEKYLKKGGWMESWMRMFLLQKDILSSLDK